MTDGKGKGSPDDGYANGEVIDAHNVNAAVVGSSVADADSAVGSPAAPDVDDEDQTAAGDDGGYDPGEDTVADVRAYVDRHPDQAAGVLESERAGKARSTLLADLERIVEDDEDDGGND